MTTEEFNRFWTNRYPATIPVPHYFRKDYTDRWFRIHSLPESKRYAEDDEDWEILLSRQNAIIFDLIGDSTNVYVVTGFYCFADEQDHLNQLNNESFHDLKFMPLTFYDLHALRPEDYEDGINYQAFIAKLSWKPHHYDDLLKAIAYGDLCAFFINVDQQRLIAPYDGGMDLVLENQEARDLFKEKYKDWLSVHPEGL